MENALVVHVKDGKSNLSSPIDYLFLFQFLSSMIFFLLNDELVEVTSRAKLHDDIQIISFLKALTV